MKILGNAIIFSKLKFLSRNSFINKKISNNTSKLFTLNHLANQDNSISQYNIKIDLNIIFSKSSSSIFINNIHKSEKEKKTNSNEDSNHNLKINNYKSSISLNSLLYDQINNTNFFSKLNQIKPKIAFISQKNFPNNKYSTLLKIHKTPFCVLRESEGINTKKVEKAKKKFSGEANPQQNSSKLLLIEKNIIATLDTNISPDIKSELDSGIKMFTEIEKEDKTPMSKVDAYYFMKSIDGKFESFFHNREFSIKNFNYYMQVLSSQFKLKEMEATVLKMREMGINPSLNTFVILMTAYAKQKNIAECERVFALIKKIAKTKINIYTYNTLLLAYAKNGLVNQAESIINEMLRIGLEPDSACYTTLIHAYKKTGDYSKCWEIYEDCQFKGKVDEFLISYMIKLAGYTKNPERALLLYEYFELEGFNHYTINFNSLLFALSSTKKYAEKALEVFKKMKMKNVMPDSYTYVCLLRATAHLGDINTANEIIKEMKLMNLPMNEYICNGLIRTYAGAARIPYVKTEHLDEYLKDSWNIFSFMEKNEMKISVQILDSLLEVHCIVHKIENVDGLVLPLYEKYGFEFTLYTYEKLSKMLLDLRMYDRVIRIYETLLQKSEKSGYCELTDRVLNCTMETGLRTNDCDLIVSCLKNFGNIKAKPQSTLLRSLASMENLPDSLYVELRKFVDSDKIGRIFRAFTPAQIREKPRTPTPNMRKRGKRIK